MRTSVCLERNCKKDGRKTFQISETGGEQCLHTSQVFPRVEGSYSWPAAFAHAGHPMEAHPSPSALQPLAEEMKAHKRQSR